MPKHGEGGEDWTNLGFKGLESMRPRKGGRLYRALLPTGPCKVIHFCLPQLPRGETEAREGKPPAKSCQRITIRKAGCELGWRRVLSWSPHLGSPGPEVEGVHPLLGTEAENGRGVVLKDTEIEPARSPTSSELQLNHP